MTEKTIDLRSDTVTQPTQAMRKAMMEAEVGDDVYGEDPTVNRLEQEAAALVGKEAAVFVPSGTMANQIAIWVHTGRQGSMICEAGSHVYAYEAGAPALLSSVLVRPVVGVRGVFTGEHVRKMIPPDDPHFSRLRLIEIENTHNRAGGTLWTPRQTRDVAEAAVEAGLPVHLDGARVFNAAVAQAVNVAKLTEPVDSVAFCLSKGLSAPMGSLLCGTRDFIEEARYVRKIFGGGMRQAGFAAAAGRVALETMVDRLSEDHAHARRLAEGLATIEGIHVDLETVQSNIVIFDAKGAGFSAARFTKDLKNVGVLCSPRDTGDQIRMVTHRHIRSQDVDVAVDQVRRVVRRAAPTAGVGA